MLSNLPSSKAGMATAAIITTPPIEGTPFFCTPYGSISASRALSMCELRFMYLMKRLPNHSDMSNDKIRAIRDLKETYSHNLAPGMLSCSKKSEIE